MNAPRLASWMLKAFGCNANNEAVLGDLEERYLQGKTAAWYWRQVFVAIVVSVYNDTRTSKVRTVLVLAAAWTTYFTLGYVLFGLGYFSNFIQGPYAWLQSYLPQRWVDKEWFAYLYGESGLFMATIVLFLIGVVSGQLAARLHPHRRRATVLLFGATILIWWIQFGITATDQEIGAGWGWELYFWTDNFAQVLGILAGGLISRKTFQRHTRTA